MRGKPPAPAARRSVPRDMRDIYDQALAAGWSVKITGGGHLRWQAPDGTLIFTSRTPSDHRSIHNEVARFKRAGLHA